MKIGLIDVDKSNKFPNLALMKISAYYKNKGDVVEFYSPMFGGMYDIVYVSKIFDYSLDYLYPINSKKIVYGGVGYDLKNKLPKKIENTYPDYNLYNFVGDNTAYGFLTRGCPRGCSFCNVTENQGKITKKVANLSDFWNGQKKIVLLDPNILASSDWNELFQQLIDSKSWVDFTQGLDIRLLDNEKIEMLNKIKTKSIHFSWDNAKDKVIENKFKEVRKILLFRDRELIVYVLSNFDTSIEEDIYRIIELSKMGYTPYLMIFDKDKLPKGHKLKKMQRMINNRFIYQSIKNNLLENLLEIS